MPKRQKKPGKGGKKVRVHFRRNRQAPAREKDWTRQARESGAEHLDTTGQERVTSKGALSRKRTVIVRDTTDGDLSDTLREGLVITVFGAVAHVDDGERTWPCAVRRVLRTLSIRDRNAVCVGDRVRFRVASVRGGVEEEGVIERIEPRRSELKRTVRHREHVVAANVDQVLIVSAASHPTPKANLVDRYIISALHGRMEPVICLNKMDEREESTVADFLNVYRSLPYRTVVTSAVTGQGMDELADVLRDKSTALVGQSGVGKSSMLNAHQPGLRLAIGDLTDETFKGRHTTTRANLLRLDIGGFVVDTPGIRAFDMSNVPRELLESYFVEFIPHVTSCKFADCTHIHEEECAVQRAVEAGDIHPNRFANYVRMFSGEECR